MWIIPWPSLPEALTGRSFIRSSFFGTRKVCRQPGVAYAITPARGQGRQSRADQLERMGFRQAIVSAVRVVSDGTALDCAVYQKRMREGERIDIGSPGLVLTSDAPWCVLVAAAPSPAGKTGDHAGYGGMEMVQLCAPTRPKSFLSSRWRRTTPSQPKFPIMLSTLSTTQVWPGCPAAIFLSPPRAGSEGSGRTT